MYVIEYKSPQPKNQFNTSVKVPTERQAVNRLNEFASFCDTTFKGICEVINDDIVALDKNIKVVCWSVNELTRSVNEIRESQRALRDSIQETIQNSIQQSMRVFVS
ncbi:hypothetical protein M9Y10_014294 [Tritrichomonas musculus]|uniref:Uncharacterized protein n=1 Tax=Tritrichomonas musculus TaxID=1915356 RepID=A0ABR2KZ50_9EUKA